MTSVLTDDISVWPSGLARATCWLPILPAGARDILHHHGLAELGRQPLGHEAGDDVGTGARRERHDELDRLIGPGEGGLEGERRGREAGGEGQELAAAHGALKQPRLLPVDTTYARFTYESLVL